MAKRTALRDDPARTDQLAIDELFVLKGKGDDTHYHAWLNADEPDRCPRCGCPKLKQQDLFSRTYTDCITVGMVPRIIELVYSFHKYRCAECRHIFALPITFASVNDNVTRRLEDRIARMVMAEASYGAIAASFRDRLSRQAVGQIFNRWVRSRNELRVMDAPPTIAAIVTGHTDKGEYTLLLGCDNGIRILDILLGIDTDGIITSVRRFCGSQTAFVLTDCDPVVYAAAKQALPRAVHIIPAEMWLRLVRADYCEFVRPHLKWVTVAGKERLMLEPTDEASLPYELRRIFDARPQLQDPHADYHYLRSTILRRDERWHINELDEWPDAIDTAFKAQLDITLLTYREYRAEIAAHQEHWDIVPDGLLSAVDRLEALIRTRRTFCEEALQAAVLYAADAPPGQGPDINDVIQELTKLQHSSGRNDHDS